MDNNNSQMLIVLHGFNETKTNRQIYFAFTLALYLFTIFVNVMLFVTLFLEKMLREPMYMLICNLCVNGLFGATSFYPKLLYDLLSDVQVITYNGCLSQLFGVYSYVFCEFTNLTVMAYDRYVAICKPLQYHTIMTVQRAGQLLVLTWVFILLETSIGTVLTARLPLCGNYIDRLFCTNWGVVQLSCVDTTLNNIFGFVLMFSHVAQMMLVVVSYGHITKALLESKADRRKFMRTCLPHLITLVNFTLTLMFDSLYARYGSSLQSLSHVMSTEFIIVPPLINPIIYGMNLHQIRRRVFQIFSHKVNAVS